MVASTTAHGEATIMNVMATLTTGMPRLTSVVPLSDQQMDGDGLLRIAAGAEQFSEHPLGRAVVASHGSSRLPGQGTGFVDAYRRDCGGRVFCQ
jgi:cation-transporting P-type ATPase D